MKKKKILSNPFFEFHDLVKNKPKRFNKEIKQYVKIQKQMLKKFDFIEEKGSKVVEWIEKYCILIDGENAGEKVKLLLWQKWYIYSIFCFWGDFEEQQIDDSGNIVGTIKKYLRVINDVLFVVGTGNAKTTLLAFINAYILYSKNYPSSKIYIGSNSKPQSMLCFNTTLNLIKKNPILDKYAKPRPSINEIEVRESIDDIPSFIYAMSSDGKNYEGIVPTIIMLDEIHEFKDGVYAKNLRKSIKRDDAFIFESTTNGNIRGGYLDERIEYSEKVLNGEIINYRFMPVIFKQESEKEVIDAYYNNDIDILMRANPSLGKAISITLLLSKIKSMIDDPTQRVAVLTKNCNLPQNPETSFYSKEECQTKVFNEDIFYNAPVFFGFDMAWTRTPQSDLACLRMMTVNPFNEKRYCKDFIFLPKYYSFQEDGEVQLLDMIKYKSKQDSNIPYDAKNKKYGYQMYADKGHLVIVDEELISTLVNLYGEQAYSDCTGITEDFILYYMAYLEYQYKFTMCKFGLDPNKASKLESYLNTNVRSLDEKDIVIKFQMERTNISNPMMERTKDLRARRLIYNNNKLTELHFFSAQKKDTSTGFKIINAANTRKDAVIAEAACESAYNVFTTNRDTGIANLNMLKEWWQINEERIDGILAESSISK